MSDKRTKNLNIFRTNTELSYIHSLDAYDNGLDLMKKDITFSPKIILDSLQMTQYDEYHFLHSFPLTK